MRLYIFTLALTAALAPLAARAQIQDRAVQDRYDAPGPEAALPAGGAGLRGAQTKASQPKPTFLSWAGKVDVLRGPEGAGGGDSLRGSAPLDTSTGRIVREANPSRLQLAPQAQSQSESRTQAPAQSQPTRLAYAQPPQLRPQATQQTPQRLPASLYDQGYGQSQGQSAQTQNTQAQNTQAQNTQPQARPTQPVAARRLQPATLAGAAPQTDAQLNQQQAYQSQPAQQGSGGAGGPRFYSLHREYGIQPDPAPQAQPSVLSLSPTVAQAMADNKDDGPPIDLAGQDQANVSAPPRLRNNSDNAPANPNSTTTTNAAGQTTTTYSIRQ